HGHRHALFPTAATPPRPAIVRWSVPSITIYKSTAKITSPIYEIRSNNLVPPFDEDGNVCLGNLQSIGISLIAGLGIKYGDQLPDDLNIQKKYDEHLKNDMPNARVTKYETQEKPSVLFCPSDKNKIPATSWADLNTHNISYQIKNGVIRGSTAAWIICPIHGVALCGDQKIRTLDGTELYHSNRGWIPRKEMTPDELSSETLQNITFDLIHIDGAKNQWALENGKVAGSIPTEDDLKPYLSGRFPEHPSGGHYIINPVGQNPESSTGVKMP
ncbi:MAG TPA: hypothetical protein VIK53_02590, partial [Verrucomicrobiae bacterium]